ncbi:MAG: hypothetical protein HYS78_02360 [Parcubacteria group bacterium]|nr:hypothetical protein [Parcubacteria group bacterium]
MKNKILLLAAFSSAFFFIFVTEANAFWPAAAAILLIPLGIGILKAFISVSLFIAIVGGVNYIAGQLVNWGISFQNTLLDPSGITAIQTTWEILRDFVNVFFILVLLIIAFATIFNKPTGYTAKDLLPKLIIAALLINFSLVIAAWAIELLWVPATVFLKPIGQDISGQIANALDTQQFFNPNYIKYITTFLSGGIVPAISGTEWIFRSFLLVINAFLFSWIALILWARIPILMGLMIISPLAWLGYTIPAIKKGTWDAWWEKLLCWGVIPIPLFGLIYFVIFFHQRLAVEINQAIPGSVLNSVLDFLGLSVSGTLVWLITAGIFLAGMMYVKGLSCSMYNLVMAGFKGTWKGVRGGVGATTDLLYAATGYKGAIETTRKRLAEEGYPIPIFGKRFGAAQRKATEARREDQVAGWLGLTPTHAAQRDLLDGAEKATKNIDNRFKVASETEVKQITAELKDKVEKGAKDPETLAAINVLAKKGELDIGIFNKAVDNFKDMPLAINKVFSEWKEGKFGGLAKAEDLLTILKDNRLGREAKALGYAFVASKDGNKVAEKMTLDDYTKGYQILGRNTKEGREFKKNTGKLKPSMVAEYNWAHRTEEFEPDKMPRDMADAVLKQIEGASAKDFGDYNKDEWDNPNFRTGLTKLMVEKKRQIPGSERKFKQELAKRFIREGKGKQLKVLNDIPPFVDIKEVNMGEPPEETETEETA